MKNQLSNLAFVFPGQGSQTVGMLDAMADSHPGVKHVFERGSDQLGFDLWALVHAGPAEQLNQTYHTQPAMLAAGYAVWSVWCANTTTRPYWVAGHSLGEYTALVCAGAMAFETALQLVVERGKLMQAAVPEGVGAMAAILGLEDHVVVNLCAEAAGEEVVAAVNFNSPEQVVIAGHTAAVERAMLLAKKAGAKRALSLPVSVPSHCVLMAQAAQALWLNLQAITVETPEIKVVHNVDVRSHSAAEVIKQALKEQLYNPVRWSDSVQFLHEQGVDTFVECGPGKVLMGLNKRIVKSAQHFSIYDPVSLNQVLEHFNG